MDKVIIDGVDVSFCQYFNDKNKKCRTFSIVDNVKFTSYKCEDDKNCYYKQLKKLEQETECLKSQIDFEAQKNEVLLQENEKLKARVKEISEKMSFLNADRCSEIIRYKQVLEEIRDVLNTCLEFKNCEKCFFYTRCNKDLEGFVLNKINEVIGAEE